MSVFYDLISIIRHNVFGCEDPGVEIGSGVVRLAEKHELAHLLNADIPAYQKAVYSKMRQDAVLERISSEFDTCGIDYLPMKGSVLADYYPERWMRSSCDIDILVHPEDFKASCRIAEELGGVKDTVNSNSLHAGFEFCCHYTGLNGPLTL